MWYSVTQEAYSEDGAEDRIFSPEPEEGCTYAPDLDFAILAEEPEGVWQMAALAKGGRVAVYRYAGTEKLEEHLELLASPLIDKD